MILIRGDFTEYAKYYNNRPGYSAKCLSVILEHIKKELQIDKPIVADIGAGTGKLTNNLIMLGLSGYAIEPNEHMLKNRLSIFNHSNEFEWHLGSAEETFLEDNSIDWVLMGSAFHWVNSTASLQEFYRILKPQGFLTVLWNPPNLDKCPLQAEIENIMHSFIPSLNNRKISGIDENLIKSTLLQHGLFSKMMYLQQDEKIVLTKERYLGIWQSGSIVQTHTDSNEYLNIIENKVNQMDDIEMYYTTKAFTVQSNKI